MTQLIAILIGMAIGCSGYVLAHLLNWIVEFYADDDQSWTPNADDLEDQYK
jgi:hypothetical protein